MIYSYLSNTLDFHVVQMCPDCELACCSVYTHWCLFVPSGWGLQAKEHAALAREQLPFVSSVSCREKKLEILMCLLSIHLTQGAASLTAAKYPCIDMFNINVDNGNEQKCQLD